MKTLILIFALTMTTLAFGMSEDMANCGIGSAPDIDINSTTTAATATASTVHQ